MEQILWFIRAAATFAATLLVGVWDISQAPDTSGLTGMVMGACTAGVGITLVFIQRAWHASKKWPHVTDAQIQEAIEDARAGLKKYMLPSLVLMAVVFVSGLFIHTGNFFVKLAFELILGISVWLMLKANRRVIIAAKTARDTEWFVIAIGCQLLVILAIAWFVIGFCYFLASGSWL